MLRTLCSIIVAGGVVETSASALDMLRMDVEESRDTRLYLLFNDQQ